VGAPFQVLPDLDPPTEAALRASIERFGVLVPVLVDQHGRIIDGHHRARLASELGVMFEPMVIDVDDDDHARQLAAELNLTRRHMTGDELAAQVEHLRSLGHSWRAIGGALGVSHEHARSLADPPVNALTGDDRVTGRDGKSYPRKGDRRAADARPGVSKWSRAVQGVSKRCPVGELTDDELDELLGAATFLANYCRGVLTTRKASK
jgi:ParB-like chromosome segregation protein Spo0J